MTAVTTLPDRRSLIVEMANRYSMEPKAFSDTLRATVVPKNVSNEEFAAFLMVAHQYNLNPVTREIYAFPKPGGGIQPIVSVDGWCRLINSHPESDGIEFDDILEDNGNLRSVTCRIYRKDRSRPITATEYMVECRQNNQTWQKWPRRMLRHKALIQAARYAFGFAGIVDPDEAERFINKPLPHTSIEVQPNQIVPTTTPPLPIVTLTGAGRKPPVPPKPVIKAPEPEKHDTDTGEIIPDPTKDADRYVRWAIDKINSFKNANAANDWFNETIPQANLLPPDEADILEALRKLEEKAGQ